MWAAEGVGQIGFCGHDGWDGSPDTDAKYANLTSYAHHLLVVEAERTADVYQVRVDGYKSDTETDVGSKDGQDF